MRVAFFEDQGAAECGPLTHTRPVFELLCGRFSLRERVLRGWDITEWGAFLRYHLAEVYREEHPEARVNDRPWLLEAPTLLIHGRWLPAVTALDRFRPDQIGYCDDVPVYVMLEPDEVPLIDPSDWQRTLETLATTRKRIEVGGHVFRHPWELVEHNSEQLESDFRLLQSGGRLPEAHPQIAIVGPEERIEIHSTARIDPFVVLDARGGPITVDAGAIVQPFTRLEGPCYIGRETHLFRANIKGGTTLGPVCRVGGEIEAAIIQGYTNKYHDGFLGHSYVGSWVNLGAQTVTSDLKVDYSTVTVPLMGESISTAQMKVGSFLGDFTKTGINAVFNTGTSVGVMCMVLPTGDYSPRHVPSFCGIRGGELVPGLPLERGIDLARATLGRRGHTLTPARERLLRYLYQSTRHERDVAFARAARQSLSNSATPAASAR